MLTAIAWMGVLGIVGLVIGMIAQSTVDHSVVKLVGEELEALSPSQNKTEPIS